MTELHLDYMELGLFGFLDYMEHIKTKVGQLTQFLLSFIDMVEILLSKIYAAQTGNCFLLLEWYHYMMPYTFAYDHLNYAKYLPPILTELTELEDQHPEVCRGLLLETSLPK